MHPRRVIGPLVLFSGACATAPPTPSSTFLARAEEVPAGRAALMPAYADAYAAWLLPPTSVWARYSKSTLLAALGDAPMAGVLPDTSGLSIVHRAEAAAARLASAGLPPDTLIVVDLRGAAAVAFGNALSHRAGVPVSLVLTFNNWPAPREVVPAEETLSALVSMRPRVLAPQERPGDPQDRSSRPVFLLDAWRLAYRDSQPDDESYDNRYALGPADLPDAATLVQQGIRSVLYVVEHRDSDTVEEDDLHASFTAYQQAGLSLHLVDLADLGEAGDSASFSRCLVRTRYSLRPRVTLLSSPAFFMRSRGGFGGPHARPSHVGYSHGFHGPSHGHGHGHGHGGFRGGGHGG